MVVVEYYCYSSIAAVLNVIVRTFSCEKTFQILHGNGCSRHKNKRNDIRHEMDLFFVCQASISIDLKAILCSRPFLKRIKTVNHRIFCLLSFRLPLKLESPFFSLYKKEISCVCQKMFPSILQQQKRLLLLRQLPLLRSSSLEVVVVGFMVTPQTFLGSSRNPQLFQCRSRETNETEKTLTAKSVY